MSNYALCTRRYFAKFGLKPKKSVPNLSLRDKRPIIVSQRKRNAELEEKAAASGLEWRILASS